MYEALTQFIDRLEPACKRTVEQGGQQFCYLEYNETVNSYKKALFSIMQDRDPDYHEYLSRHSVDLSDNLNYLNMASLTGETILYLLLYIERGERSSAGFRSRFIRNCFINDALRRLLELDNKL